MLYTRKPWTQQQAKHFDPNESALRGGMLKQCGGTGKSTARRTVTIVLRQYMV
ncbi:hypothetical protein ALP16_100663 [Pseudomonas savastanoi]|uniref:Uncharacterized protein n=2 Tax=Pseudomonas syringae group genomosp. 2 TaxID=251698 RepID=A0A3M6AHM1_PSESS|nr:hypothetical protein ALO74_100642 [Pseudomonas syringae pv. cunninghamiae]KPX95943.1 hypothetical protein ALO64_100055 [Pseudomonas meliae]RMV09403.1 hypothetical protein ALP17_102330 [Pseudomonas savastanoi]RMV16229.1 hypothetical protein ALP15_100613 [Pseudomonas savastanoi]RMV18710.1 hypothetical protein ALP16_100663 [Pseudomonas savastanoi]